MTSDTAAALDAHVLRRRDDIVQLASSLIAIDSQIPPFGDERRIAGFLRDVLRDRGLEVRLAGDTTERPSVIGRLRGGSGPTLALCGHLDTKPIGEASTQWRTDPLTPTVLDGVLYGLGAADMKGAVAAMVVAIDAIRALGSPPGDVMLVLVADEEAGGLRGARRIAPELGDVDALLIGEPSGWDHDWQAVHVVSRGSCCFRIRVHGTQGHSSLTDRMDLVNASVKMAELLTDMADELPLMMNTSPGGSDLRPTLNRGVMVTGGTWFGVVPGSAEFACDLRTVPGMTFESVRDELEEWLQTRGKRDPALRVELVFEPGLEWVPPSSIDTAHPLVSVAQEAVTHVLHSERPLGVFPGATDAPWFSSAGIPTLPSLGPGLISVAHGPNERVSVQSLTQAAQIYARIGSTYGATHRRVQNGNDQ